MTVFTQRKEPTKLALLSSPCLTHTMKMQETFLTFMKKRKGVGR
jgi:hypothetical protein